MMSTTRDMPMELGVFGGASGSVNSDALINDEEHPDLVNSLSSDEGLGDNAESTIGLSSILSSQPLNTTVRIFPNTDSGFSPHPLPPPLGAQNFTDQLLGLHSMSTVNINSSSSPVIPVSSQTFQEIKESGMRTLLNSAKTKQDALLMTIKRKKERQEEILALRENVSQLQDEKQTLTNQLATIIPSCQKKLKDAKTTLSSAERELKRCENKLKDKTERRDKLKSNLDEAKRRYDQYLREDKQLAEWFSNHNVTFHVTSADSSTESETSVDSSTESKVIFQLNNVNLEDPLKMFYVVLDSIIPQTGHFSVQSVFPEFEDALSVIKRAERNQDFVQFLRECKDNWRRDV